MFALRDGVPIKQFVGLGDALALHRLDTLIHAHNRQGRVRLATRVDFSDLRDSPTILIGGFTNRWMMEFNLKLRFHFGHLPNGRPGILDRASDKAYPLPERQENGSYREDYLVICRLPRPHPCRFAGVDKGIEDATRRVGI